LKQNNLKILDEKESQSARWFAIISQLKPYALIWAINDATSIQFKPGEFFVKNDYFPKYCFQETFPKIDYTIFVNKIDSGVIFKDIKNADYLLKIEALGGESVLLAFLTKIKKINEIKGVMPLALDRLKKDKKIICSI